MLIVIEGPDFVCGLGVEDHIVAVVPPLFNWAKGKSVLDVAAYCARKGFRFEEYIDADKPDARRDAGALPRSVPRRA
jgi:hypothetical protein